MNRMTRTFCRWLGLATILGIGAAPTLVVGEEALPKPRVMPASHVRQAVHPLDPALKMARASLHHIQANVHDYSALFVKRCRVDGILPELQYANVKIRNRKSRDGNVITPMAAYLGFLKPDSVKGREVIWVEGQNEGNLIAHETGIKGMMNFHLDPNGYLAMRGQRHPITDIGIENLVAKLIETGERDHQHGECQVQFYQNAKIGDAPCTMLEVIHPVRRPHFDFYRARVYFDNNLNMPIRYESWSWPTTAGGEPVLEEEYTYLRVKVNIGLTDRDFDISNPNYRFQ